MTEAMMKVVHGVRIGIYISLFVVLVFVAMRPYLHATPWKGSYEEPEAFWPPDMVPHPHPPQPPDKDDDMA